MRHLAVTPFARPHHHLFRMRHTGVLLDHPEPRIAATIKTYAKPEIVTCEELTFEEV